MSEIFPFTKMHGLGNDFIVVDLRAIPFADWFDDPSRIAALCDRRHGIGADGVLAIQEPRRHAREQGAVARLRIRNADGSEAEMCGNGLRCVARYLQTSDRVGPQLKVETGAGILDCVLLDDGLIEIAMGKPSWEQLDAQLAIGGSPWPITTVSMGNPHAVIFCDEASSPLALQKLAEQYGAAIENAPNFPDRTNVEFVRRHADGTFTVVVWERGCGITLACGTGACAAVVAACVTERSQPGEWRLVHLPGGALSIRVEPDLGQVYLRGPATTVFRGQYSRSDS